VPSTVEDYETTPWTVEEMNLLADEAEEMISQRESSNAPNALSHEEAE
jgi:hypothetical protein